MHAPRVTEPERRHVLLDRAHLGVLGWGGVWVCRRFPSRALSTGLRAPPFAPIPPPFPLRFAAGEGSDRLFISLPASSRANRGGITVLFRSGVVWSVSPTAPPLCSP